MKSRKGFGGWIHGGGFITFVEESRNLNCIHPETGYMAYTRSYKIDVQLSVTGQEIF